MSVQPAQTSSDVLPAVMLAMLVAMTGLEAGLVLATPHKADAHVFRLAANMPAGLHHP